MSRWREDRTPPSYYMPDPVSYIEDYIDGAKRIEKLLKGERFKHEHDKEHTKRKTYSKTEVTCWSFLLLLTAPWSGLYVLKAFSWAQAEWALVLVK